MFSTTMITMNKAVPLSNLSQSLPSARPAGFRICIVTGEIAGPFFNGGVGTVNRALALVLRKLGYNVQILYTRVAEGKPFNARGNFTDHVEAFRKLGIELMCIDHQGKGDDWLAMSYLTLQHLLRHRCDLVFFDDLFGNGYYSLLARRTGQPALADVKMCVTTHATLQWVADLNQVLTTKIEDLRWAECERRSIELADSVRAPSAYILKKYRSYGWTIPENAIVSPNFVSAERGSLNPRKRMAVREIVFFGRLETRKGLWMFCRAIDRLKYNLSGCRVTFLGKSVTEHEISNAELIIRHSATWPFAIRLLTNFDRDQALRYLKAPGRLAIMSSFEDNSPSTILECIEEGIPFLACSGSGGEELLDEEGRKANLFQPTVDHLCTKLLETIQRGAMTAHASFDQVQLQNTFAKWLESILRPSSRVRAAPDTSELPKPILIVVVPPEFDADGAIADLQRAIDSFRGEVNIEVLATHPKEFQGVLTSTRVAIAVNVNHISDFEKIARSAASRQPTVVGLCHITQLLPPAWIERARACFAVENEISALTGMVAVRVESDVRARDSYVSAANGDHKIERYLMGYAPPLFPLAQDTNSGFVLMRSELLAKCASLGPTDEQYDRPRRMQDWIHDILVTLHSLGERFELVPDLVIEQPVREAPFEVFLLERLMRALPSTLYGYTPGSDQFAVARLAVDTSLERERFCAHSKYVRSIAERIGREVSQLPLYTPWEEQVRQLATIAHANGQIDLATDLCAELAIEGEPEKSLKLAEYVQSAAAGEIVNLVEALAEDNTTLNVGENSIWGLGGGRNVVIHVPPQGGFAGYALPKLNLSKITHFIAMVEVRDKTADAVRFRIELISQDKKNHWSAEKVLNGGEESLWELECPSDMRGKCSAQFGIENADRQRALKPAIGRWNNPRFVRRP
jgi:glycosyltransferase involved in cell wall biosynthesis